MSLQKQYKLQKDSDYTDTRDMRLTWHCTRFSRSQASSEAQNVDLVKVHWSNVRQTTGI